MKELSADSASSNDMFLLTGMLLGATVLAGGALLSASSAYADTDNVSVIVPISCTMTSTGNTSHNAEINNGRYVSEIGTTTLKVICNDNAGFSIYAAGYTGNELGGTNSTKLVGQTNAGLISTGTATSGNTSNWAMKLATDGTATYPITLQNGFGSYSAVPASYTKVATRASGTDNGTNATGSTLTTTYAAYINTTQTTDTYVGQVIYTLVHPASEEPAQPRATQAGKICYYANASSAEGTMSCQLVSTSATSATLLASNFSRTGYGFAGWSDKYDYATNDEARFYGPQEYITFTAGQYTGSNPGLSLYAVWVKSAGTLQDQTKVATLCGTSAGSLTTAPTDGTANLTSVSALTDQRDNQTYAIAKLADGNCWMIENLRLETAGTVGNNQTNPSVTNASLSQGYGTSTTYGNFTGLATAESSNFTTTNPPIANSLYSTDGTTTNTIQGGNSSYYYARMPRYNNTNSQNRTTTGASNVSGDNATGGMYSYGNYYTWAAAIADIAYYDTSNQSVTNVSLCPTGWRLPKGGDKTRIISNNDNEFWTLTVTYLNNGTNPTNYNSQTGPFYTGTTEAGPVANALRSYPNNFIYSGKFESSRMTNRGYYGLYWSSTTYSQSSSYSLLLNNSNVNPGTTSGNRYIGYTIRCLTSSGT